MIAVIFGALLVIPLFIPSGRRERGFIYGAELALVLFAWFKIKDANVLMIGQILWLPKEVDYFRNFLLIVAAVTALFLLYQFIPGKSSSENPPDDESSRSDSATSAR
ncbi:MAG TPA: hypothetical protein VI636_00770 [Candidatus Angelobacter sp.]